MGLNLIRVARRLWQEMQMVQVSRPRINWVKLPPVENVAGYYDGASVVEGMSDRCEDCPLKSN